MLLCVLLVLAGAVEPAIDHTAIPPAAQGEPVLFFARVTNARFVPALHFRDAGTSEYVVAAMQRNGEDFAAAVLASGDLEYWLDATELRGKRRVLAGSPESPLRLHLALPGSHASLASRVPAQVVEIPVAATLPWATPGTEWEFWLPVGAVGALTLAVGVLLVMPPPRRPPRDFQTTVSVNPP
jgi:hypothetical protein